MTELNRISSWVNGATHPSSSGRSGKVFIAIDGFNETYSRVLVYTATDGLHENLNA